MLITREQIIRRLSERTGYYQKDIRALLSCMDEEIFEMFNEVEADEEVRIVLFEGIKVGCTVVPERERLHPKTKEPIICKPTVKPFVKFSVPFRIKIQDSYDNKCKKMEE